MITLKVNGESHELDVSPEMPLLWALRDRLHLTGTKFGCGKAMCGACTVHIDGQAARSCSIMVGEAAGKTITTIEAVSGRVAEAVTQAWQRLDVVQCGYCQSGQIMSAIVLLNGNKSVLVFVTGLYNSIRVSFGSPPSDVIQLRISLWVRPTESRASRL